MNASVAIQTLPEAKDDEELIRIVDQVIDYIKSTGLSYYVGPFETAIIRNRYILSDRSGSLLIKRTKTWWCKHQSCTDV